MLIHAKRIIITDGKLDPFDYLHSVSCKICGVGNHDDTWRHVLLRCLSFGQITHSVILQLTPGMQSTLHPNIQKQHLNRVSHSSWVSWCFSSDFLPAWKPMVTSSDGTKLFLVRINGCFLLFQPVPHSPIDSYQDLRWHQTISDGSFVLHDYYREIWIEILWLDFWIKIPSILNQLKN